MALFSVKMRSSKEGLHISGAERIVREERVDEVTLSLLKRAKNHSRGKPDFISIKIEELKEEPLYLQALPVYEVREESSPKGLLERLFSSSAVPVDVGLRFYRLLLEGISPSKGVMRGAAIVEIPSGRRLEPDRERGVRVSFIDITDDAAQKLRELVGDKYTENLKEALTLSTKVLNYRDVLAELCISDDPDYTTGYLSIKGLGYFRLFNLKPSGLPLGGRVFFVKEGVSLEDLTSYLERKPVVVSSVSSYSVISLEELEELR